MASRGLCQIQLMIHRVEEEIVANCRTNEARAKRNSRRSAVRVRPISFRGREMMMTMSQSVMHGLGRVSETDDHAFGSPSDGDMTMHER